MIEHCLQYCSLAAFGDMKELTCSHLQQREDHWAIIDLNGKAGHIRTVPMPDCIKGVVDEWLCAAGITSGRLFRRVSKMVRPGTKASPGSSRGPRFSFYWVTFRSKRPSDISAAVNDRLGIEPKR